MINRGREKYFLKYVLILKVRGNHMLLSVIIPAFNAENKIERCLKSLIKLREKNVEFIIVDDGSSDNTAKICEEFLKADSRFRMIRQNNSGVSGARNKGIEHARGKYIGFVDADDEVTGEYEDIIREIKNTEYDLYSFPFYIQYSNILKKQERVFYKEGKNEKKLLYNNFLRENSNCVWNNIYRLSVIRNFDIKFMDGMKMGEDCIFNAQYFQNCKEVDYINKYGYIYYYDDNSSASRTRRIEYLKDFVKIYDTFFAFYDTFKNLDLEFEFSYQYYFDMVYEILSLNHSMLTRKQKKEVLRSKFYKKMMKYQYAGKRGKLRKLLVKIWLNF